MVSKSRIALFASTSAGPANITKVDREAKGIVAIDCCPMRCVLKTTL